MATYFLVLVIANPTGGHGVATSNIPGFTKDTCLITAAALLKRKSVVDALCITPAP